jgi:hypothetical protein
MKNLSLAVPSLGEFAPSVAPPFDIRTLDASAILLKLSVDLQPTDQLTIFGTLDVTATPSSPNLNLLGEVIGNNGQAVSGNFVSYWPYLFIERTAGTTPTSPTSLFFASSATAIGASAPLTTALPSNTFFSTLINLEPFGNPVRVGLDGNQTEIDTFSLYGTDDSTTTGFSGGTLLANLQGGGSLSSSALVSAYQYVYVLRTGGFTAGNLIAWSTDDPGGGGGGSTAPINLESLAVNNTAVNGNFGTPPLTAAQSVDIYSSFVLTQTTALVTAALPTPTITTAGKIVFVSVSSASTSSIMMYGLTIDIDYGASFQWDGSEWTPVGVGNAFTDGGNEFGHTTTLATLDNHNLIIAAGGPVPTTGNVIVNANGQVSVTSGNGDTVLTATGSTSGLALQTNGAGAAPLKWFNTANTFFSAFKAFGTLAASTTWVLPQTDGTAGASSALVTDGAGDLSFTQVQSGTSSIGATGVSAAIAANIKATSRILITVKDFVASTAVGLEAKSASRTIGTPGSFVVTAYDASGAAVVAASGTTFDWFIFG